MKLYKIVNLDTGAVKTILESNAKNALITTYILNSKGNSFVNHKQYRNSAKRRIREVGSYLIVYNFSVKID